MSKSPTFEDTQRAKACHPKGKSMIGPSVLIVRVINEKHPVYNNNTYSFYSYI